MGLICSRVMLRAFLFLLAPLTILGSAGPGKAETDVGSGPIYVMRITGTIDLGLAPYVDRVIADAENADAEAIIIVIDTPGGRLDAVLQMRDSIMGTNIRTIALIDSVAFSAGALVAIASDEIYMTPGAVMGAATPVLGGTGEVAEEKTISAVRATFESTAEENGRDPRVAAAMVDTRIEIEGLVSNTELLTLTVSQAIAFEYTEGQVENLQALLTELGFEENQLVNSNLSFAEQVVRFLTNPLLAGFLLLGGFLLIIGDFFSEGLGIAAVGGLLLLAIFFWGYMLAGLAGWEDVALVALGIALLAVEIFIFPGFGVAGVLGLISLAAGAFLAMLYRDFDFVTNEDIWRSALTVSVSIIATFIGILLLIRVMSRRGVSGGLVLTSQLAGHEQSTTRTSSRWLRWFGSEDRLESDRIEQPVIVDEKPESSMVGMIGVAVSDLRPGGIVQIDDARIDAVTSGEFIPAGEAIEIVRDERYRRVVRKVD